MIKVIYLKKEGRIEENYTEKYLDENGNEVWNIPTDLSKFKEIAIDTINWKMGDNVKKMTGNVATNLNVANAKAIALLTKIISNGDPDLGDLSTLEKSNWEKLSTLANNGYADSELLDKSLSAVLDSISTGTTKIIAIMGASTIEEIIGILNEA